MGWFDGAVEVWLSLERRPFFTFNADQSEFVMAPHMGVCDGCFFQCRARRCLKKDQSEFLKERGKVRAFSGACGLATLQDDTEISHGAELLETRHLNGRSRQTINSKALRPCRQCVRLLITVYEDQKKHLARLGLETADTPDQRTIKSGRAKT